MPIESIDVFPKKILFYLMMLELKNRYAQKKPLEGHIIKAQKNCIENCDTSKAYALYDINISPKYCFKMSGNKENSLIGI